MKSTPKENEVLDDGKAGCFWRTASTLPTPPPPPARPPFRHPLFPVKPCVADTRQERPILYLPQQTFNFSAIFIPFPLTLLLHPPPAQTTSTTVLSPPNPQANPNNPPAPLCWPFSARNPPTLGAQQGPGLQRRSYEAFSPAKTQTHRVRQVSQNWMESGLRRGRKGPGAEDERE